MAHTKSDHVLIVIKSAISAVPVVGGPIASLISDYVPLSTQRSIESATQLLKERLENLENRIDVEAVNKDEFSELFKSCYLTIIRTTQESKLRAASAILANLLLRHDDPDKLSYTELDHLVRCVDSLSSGAIHAIGVIYKLSQNRSGLLKLGEIRTRMDNIEPSLLMGLVSELHMMHFIDLPALTLTTPLFGLEDYESRSFGFTPLGTRFVERLLLN